MLKGKLYDDNDNHHDDNDHNGYDKNHCVDSLKGKLYDNDNHHDDNEHAYSVSARS